RRALGALLSQGRHQNNRGEKSKKHKRYKDIGVHCQLHSLGTFALLLTQMRTPPPLDARLVEKASVRRAGIDPERKRRAVAWRAFAPHIAAHEPRQTTHQCEPQPCAFRTPRGAAVALHERLKNTGLVLQCDAGAGVAHAKYQALLRAERLTPRADADLAVTRELRRV